MGSSPCIWTPGSLGRRSALDGPPGPAPGRGVVGALTPLHHLQQPLLDELLPTLPAGHLLLQRCKHTDMLSHGAAGPACVSSLPHGAAGTGATGRGAVARSPQPSYSTVCCPLHRRTAKEAHGADYLRQSSLGFL